MSVRHHEWFVAVVVLAALLAGRQHANAQSLQIAISRDVSYWNYDIPDMNGYFQIYVLVMAYPGVTEVHFAAPLPDCMTGTSLVAWNSNFPASTVGSLKTGLSVKFGHCYTDVVHVLTITLQSNGTMENCCLYMPVDTSLATTEPIKALDCEGNTIHLDALAGAFNFDYTTSCGGPTEPANPVPADGDTITGTYVDLDWHSIAPLGTGLGEFLENLYLGTSPNPPLHSLYVYRPVHVGPLQPNTTYYWKVVGSTQFGGATGPVWSFQTGEATSPTKHDTWGAIKSMHRGDN